MPYRASQMDVAAVFQEVLLYKKNDFDVMRPFPPL